MPDRKVVFIPYPLWLNMFPVVEKCVCGAHSRVMTKMQFVKMWGARKPK